MNTDAGWLDRAAARRNADRASATYDASAVLQAMLRQQMIERLEWIAFAPEVIVDLGCGTGHAAAALSRRWPEARSKARSEASSTAGCPCASPAVPRPAVPPPPLPPPVRHWLVATSG